MKPDVPHPKLINVNENFGKDIIFFLLIHGVLGTVQLSIIIYLRIPFHPHQIIHYLVLHYVHLYTGVQR